MFSTSFNSDQHCRFNENRQLHRNRSDIVFRALFLLFIAMPIIEIFLLIKIGSSIGALLTIAIVIVTAVLGTWMLRAQGLSTLNKARRRMSGGQVPAFEMMEGMALGIGGALLLTPGFVTDAIGFACLIPFTRRLMVNALSKRVSVGSVAGGFAAQGPAAGQNQTPFGRATSGQSKPQHKPKPGLDGDVIEGEYTRKD